MGVKNLFYYIKNQFSKNISILNKSETFADKDIIIDNLMIDMNGLYHNSAQKIYKYGNYKSVEKLTKKINHKKHHILVFKDICETIEYLFQTTKPVKKLILCVDGNAPIAKVQQQRSRRYKSALERDDDPNTFDTCKITPGTEFMDHLSKYIDWYIKKRITEDSSWQKIEVIFSSQKVSGEGEHKLINFIRYFGKEEETFCLQGMDGDLFMLALGTHMPKFYILRDNPYDNNFFIMNIGEIRNELIEIMRWDEEKFNPRYGINDFVFLMFLLGNDFVPHIPSIEIIEGGIEVILDIYRKVCVSYGHITEEIRGNVRFVKKSFEIFLGTISQYEKGLFEQKLNSRAPFFPDPLLEKHTKIIKYKKQLNIDEYRIDYFSSCFPEGIMEEKICHDYLEGLQWVLTYYTRGVPNWNWYYQYFYAPFAYNLTNHISSFKFPIYEKTQARTSFELLLSVLPPKSANLLPEPLNMLLLEDDSPLKKFCPDTFKIDLAGKRKEWEGIVILPIPDYDMINKIYLEKSSSIDSRNISRNNFGKSYIYYYNPSITYNFKSYYGDIVNCQVKTRIIQL